MEYVDKQRKFRANIKIKKTLALNEKHTCKVHSFLAFTFDRNQGHPTTIFGKYLFG